MWNSNSQPTPWWSLVNRTNPNRPANRTNRGGRSRTAASRVGAALDGSRSVATVNVTKLRSHEA